VVIRVGVDTIPAAGEKDLRTQTVRALLVLGDRVESQRSRGRLVIVQAVKANSSLPKEVLVGAKTQRSPFGTLDVQIVRGVATTSITSDDAELLGEGLNVVTTKEVVADDIISFYLEKQWELPKAAGIVKSSGKCQKQRELSKAAGNVKSSGNLQKSSGNLFWELTQAYHRSG
jgi:hypothetical protein